MHSCCIWDHCILELQEVYFTIPHDRKRICRVNSSERALQVREWVNVPKIFHLPIPPLSSFSFSFSSTSTNIFMLWSTLWNGARRIQTSLQITLQGLCTKPLNWIHREYQTSLKRTLQGYVGNSFLWNPLFNDLQGIGSTKCIYTPIHFI